MKDGVLLPLRDNQGARRGATGPVRENRLAAAPWPTSWMFRGAVAAAPWPTSWIFRGVVAAAPRPRRRDAAPSDAPRAPVANASSEAC